MKKLLALAVLLTVMVYGVQAQEFNKFKVGLGLGYAGASGKGSKGGILVTFEPGYRITDKILANLRIESAAMVRGTTSSDGTFDDLDVAAIGSYTLNGQYYLTNSNFRPFVGFGFGLYALAAIKVEGSTGDIAASEAKFGAYPRIGFDAGHFTMSFDYNLLPNTEGAGGTKFNNSYFGIRIGGFFGGGRK